MTSNSSKIAKLSAAFRDTREAMGLDLKRMAAELGIPFQTIELIESCDWSDLPSDKKYDLASAIARRLGLDLSNFYVDRAFFFGDLDEKDTRPTDMRRERIVMTVMTVAVFAVLSWLLIPAKDITQSAIEEKSRTAAHNSVWQKPVSDQPFPVLGEFIPEIPITKEGVLINLRATDICNARIVKANGHEQNHTLRTSEPWKLRVLGNFVMHLENAGVVTVEVAGNRIYHGVGVGQSWSAPFDHQGIWIRPLRPKPQLEAIPMLGEELDQEE